MGEEAEVLPEVVEQPGLDIEDSGAKDSVFSEDPGINEEKEASEVKAEEKPARVVFDSEQQKTFNDAIDGKIKLVKEEREKNQYLQQQVDDLKTKIPVSARPVIPDLPQQFDDKYTDKMAARDKAMAAAVTFDANEKAESDRALQNQQTQQFQQIQKHQTDTASYLDTAKKLNIDQNELVQAGTNLNNMGLPLDTQNRMLTLPNGPQLAVFLSKNPLEASNLAAMSPMDAAVALATDLTQKTAEMFKPTDFPPDPTESLKGGGAQEGDPYAIKGVKVKFG